MLSLGVFEQFIGSLKVDRTFISESIGRMDSFFGFDANFLGGIVDFGLDLFVSSCVVK